VRKKKASYKNHTLGHSHIGLRSHQLLLIIHKNLLFYGGQYNKTELVCQGNLGHRIASNKMLPIIVQKDGR
jgi:hypothetical protein